MFSLALSLLAFISVAALALSIWLALRQRRLEARCQLMMDTQQRLLRDISGLCAAAVRIDERLLTQSRRLDQIAALTEDLEHQDTTNVPSYQIAIERINQGANVETLVKECGFSREEAALLIRMHGSSEASREDQGG